MNMKTTWLFFFLTGAALAREPVYQKAGLSSYQAAAHLLSRFSYGPTPGQVEEVVRQGLDQWLEGQLRGLEDSECQRALQAYPALAMDVKTMQSTYLSGIEIQRMSGARANGQKVAVAAYARQHNLETERELVRQLLAQKVTRAVTSRNQLREVMTEFWFNHFNVSRTSNPARPFVLSYERDVIRPLALGDFRTMLGATARHPAMLFYLNNAQSIADPQAPHLVELPGGRLQGRNAKKPLGLNENYARELMELHTLGVDGGYTQKDVTEVARVLTGWTATPRGPMGERLNDFLDRQPEGVHRSPLGFLFVPFLHDAGSKRILGTTFEPGRGEDEGDRLLDLLATHPKTSRRIAQKFAVRFVCDEPDPKLVDQLDRVYRSSGGSSAAMLRALYESPEFWSESALRAKVKNPLEYTVSAVRVLGGQLSEPETDLPVWTQKMGQNLYGCVPPTGYPDRSEQWVSSGTLVHRVNFAFALVSRRLRGVRVAVPSGDLSAQANQILAGRPLQQALGPVRQTLANEKFFETVRPDLVAPEGMARPGRVELNEQQRMAGVLVSCPEFQRR